MVEVRLVTECVTYEKAWGQILPQLRECTNANNPDCLNNEDNPEELNNLDDG